MSRRTLGCTVHTCTKVQKGGTAHRLGERARHGQHEGQSSKKKGKGEKQRQGQRRPRGGAHKGSQGSQEESKEIERKRVDTRGEDEGSRAQDVGQKGRKGERN